MFGISLQWKTIGIVLRIKMINRSTAPGIQTIQSIKTGFPEKNDNFFHFDTEDEVFKLEIVFPFAGYGAGIQKFERIAAIDQIFSGTLHLSAHEIAETFDQLGAYQFRSCDYYSSAISLFGTVEHFNKIVPLAFDYIRGCIYSKEELDIYKSKKVSELNISLNKTSFLANRRMSQMLYGSKHPQSDFTTVEKIESLQPGNLHKAADALFRDPVFFYTGRKDLPVREIIETGGFHIGHEADTSKEYRLPESETFEEYVHKSGATQNSMRMGCILPGRSHEDYFALQILNLVLGGYFGSRLMKNIREEKGLTYGIHSGITPYRTYSIFRISSECNSKQTEVVKREIELEIRRLQEEPVGEEELSVAKNYLSGVMLRNFDGAFSRSDQFRSFFELGGPERYYERFFDSLKSTGPGDLMRCARNYLDVNTLKYCVAGEI